MDQSISKVKLSLICKGILLEECFTLIDIYATKFHPFVSSAILNESIYATEDPFFFHDFSYTFFSFNIEFKAFSNLEDLYLRGNEINAFVTTSGMIVCKNICSWIKIKYFFFMVYQMKLSC